MPRTYQKLFKQQTVATNINGKPLPFGMRVTADDFSTFFASIGIFLIVSMTPIGWVLELLLPRWVVILGGAFLLTYLAHKIDPDGKPLLRYLKDALFYFMRSKVSDGWKPLPRAFAKKGRRHSFAIKVKRAWTDHDVPLPAVISDLGRFTIMTNVYLNLKFRAGKVHLEKSSRPGFRKKGRVYGLRPGRYELGGKEVRKEK